MATSKFQAAKSEIRIAVQGLEPNILKQVEISNLLKQDGAQWGLPKSMNGPAFAKKLIEAKFLRGYTFPFPNRSERRYAKPHVPMLEVLQSLKPNSYYTHASAMQVHGIKSEPVNDIYLNFEQSAHERGSLPEQPRIDAAFKGNPRRTNNVIQWKSGNITMLNGMQTGLLGVEEQYVEILDTEPANIRVTNLERTLIDITVRPYYCGGVEEVLSAFERAHDRVNVAQLAKYLAKLDYVYPFHQAIGWYMEKADYSDKQLKAFRSLPKHRRFYLTHKIEKPVFDDAWQIFVPSHMT
jgi:predicted transcriptional regulator of viral defense system